MHHGNPSVVQNPNPLIEWVLGDAGLQVSVNVFVEGCDAVISTLGQFQIKRYILTTGLNVDTPSDKKALYASSATEWMKKKYPETSADKQLEWKILNESGLDWTLVRLPLIDLTNQDIPVRTSLLDCPVKKISATSLAGFLVGQLADKTFIRQEPFIANG